MNNGYIVQGVGESTGCRMMTEILIQSGCIGKFGHEQEFQKYIHNKKQFITWLKSKQYNNFVVRFSFPHGQYLPDLHDWYLKLKTVYDNVYIILTTRSWICQEIGTIGGNHLKNNPNILIPTLNDRITKSYKKIFSDLDKIENGNYTKFTVMNMGDLIKYPKEHIEYLFNRLNLTIPLDFNYNFIRKDSDEKRILQYIKQR